MSLNSAFTVLTTPAPRLSEDAATALLHDQYGIDGTLKLLVSERDQNYLVRQASGREHLLKIANSAEAVEVSDFQTAALLHVEKSDPDFPVPRVIASLDGSPHIVVVGDDGRTHVGRVLSWLDGIPLRHSETKLDKVGPLGALLARLGIALHDFEHPASEYSLLWDMKQAGNLTALLHNIRDASLQALCRRRLRRFKNSIEPALEKARSQIIYNDLNPSNVLVDPYNPESITGIIDFGDMVKSPLIVDVAVGAAYLCNDGHEPLSDVVEFLSGYHQKLALQDDEIEMLFDLILTRQVMTIVITNWRASVYPENREYILRNEPRARRTIERLGAMHRSDVTDMFRRACQVGK
jgi:Ser/Thr protein kinase RdoA (MazF antagonist)